MVSAQEVPEAEMEKERQIEMGKEDIQNKPEAIRSVCLSLVSALLAHAWLLLFACKAYFGLAFLWCAWHFTNAKVLKTHRPCLPHPPPPGAQSTL